MKASKDAYDSGITRQLLVLPTGMGKTVCFASLAKHHGIDGRLLVLVHREELAAQAADKIRKWNPDFSVGIEMGTRTSNPSDRVVVASVQTIGRENSARLLQFRPEEFGAIVCDEAHHSTSASYQVPFRHFRVLPGQYDGQRRLLLGVTATPNRPDGQGLNKVYDDIVYNYSMLDAIRHGWLCNLRGIRLRTDSDISDVGTSMGDFKQNELGKAINTAARNELIAREWLRLGENRQTIAFTVDIDHAKQLAAAFERFGIPSAAVWGDDPEREDKLELHRRGRLKMLANCNVLTEGYDDPTIQCVIHAAPTKSSLNYIQKTGRGTRLPEGVNNLNEAREAGLQLPKWDCLVLDTVDNCGRHSLVTLASLFGMPSRMDLRGRPVTLAVEQFEQAAAMKPGVDLSGAEDLDNLIVHAEEVDLFTVKFPAEILENSKMAWMPTPMGNYVLTLPGGDKVTVWKDILDKWEVNGSIQGGKFAEKFGELGDALNFADRMVKRFAGSMASMLRRESKAKWRKEPISPQQIQAITWKLRRMGKALPDFTKMTKEDGTLLMSKLTAGGR